MTREEAIQQLMTLYPSHIGIVDKESQQKSKALSMAIEALGNAPTPCEKCIHVKSCRKVIILKNRTYKLIKYCSQGAERKEP